MSMQGNPHYSTAALGMIDGHDFTPAGLVSEATLALAFEQRTANLIALFAVESDSLPALAKGGLGSDAWIDAAEQIVERLGL